MTLCVTVTVACLRLSAVFCFLEASFVTGLLNGQIDDAPAVILSEEAGAAGVSCSLIYALKPLALKPQGTPVSTSNLAKVFLL